MFLTIFNAFLPVFANGVAGYLIRARGWLGGANEAGLVKALIYCFYPAFIFGATLGHPSLKGDPLQFLVAPALGFLFISTGFGVAFALARPFGIHEAVARRSFAVSTGVFNFGYLAIPLVVALYGRDTLPLLFLFNAGVEIAIWTIGILTLTGSWNRRWYRRACNGPFIAIASAALLTSTGLDHWIPEAVTGAFVQIGQIAIPLGLLLTGSVIYAETHTGNLPPSGSREALYAGSLIRLVILPVILLGFAAVLPLSDSLRQLAILQAAMPCGVFTIVLVRHYGGRPEISIRAAIPTQVLAFATTPFWIWAGLSLLG